VRILLNFGADVNQRDEKGVMPLMMASINKQQEIVKWLVKAGADTQIANEFGLIASDFSNMGRAPSELTAYLEAKMHCSSPSCSGAGVKKCTGCKQVWYSEKRVSWRTGRRTRLIVSGGALT
jgi:hypothetical protein